MATLLWVESSYFAIVGRDAIVLNNCADLKLKENISMSFVCWLALFLSTCTVCDTGWCLTLGRSDNNTISSCKMTMQSFLLWHSPQPKVNQGLIYFSASVTLATSAD